MEKKALSVSNVQLGTVHITTGKNWNNYQHNRDTKNLSAKQPCYQY